jgi:hypothetical protein
MPTKTGHPNCYIIAGSNGAGKTTFATEFLPSYANCPAAHPIPRTKRRSRRPGTGRSPQVRSDADQSFQPVSPSTGHFTFLIIDNSSEVPRLIFKDEAGKMTVLDGVLYEQLIQQFEQ